MDFLPELPRLYTGIAEWLVCLLFVIILPKRHKLRTTIIALVICLGVFVGFQLLAGKLAVILWIPAMFAAVLLLFGSLYYLSDVSKKSAAYYTIRAFIVAEFIASFEWQFYTYFQSKIYPWLEWIFLIGIYGVLFFLFYLFETYFIKDNAEIYINTNHVLVTAGIGAFTFFLSNFSYLGVGGPFTTQNSKEIFMMRTLVDLGGLAFLYVQHVQISDGAARKELETMQWVLSDQYHQYKVSKSNMEMLQMKYHDIKNQISVIRAEMDPLKQEKYLKELEREIQKYQFQYETGNSVLDILVTQKSQICQENAIEMTCILNGKLLDFMSAMDLCTIFGNALDNAIECEKKISEQEKRLIQLYLSEKNGVIVISVENYWEQTVKIGKSGLLETTKKNKKEHGFGLKSIRYSAQKYGGTMLLQQKENWVQLKIFIPQPKSEI